MFAGKKVFIAGVADDQVPALNIFETNLRRGKLDESRKLSNGSLMEFSHVHSLANGPEVKNPLLETSRKVAGAVGQ
ncbi:enoyl-ACP reductase, partial [Haematococcus lacustris]